MTENNDVDYADRIAKMLRKAEGTDNPHEAETFTAAAQRLMEKYAITEAMLEEKADRPREEIVEGSIDCVGIHRHVLKELAFAILRANTCQGFIRSHGYDRPKRVEVVVIGYESDVSRVRMLHASAQIQLEIARAKWQAEHETFSMLSGAQKKLARRDFGFGFAEGLGDKLREAVEQGREDVAAEAAAKRGVSSEEASESVALVVRDREDTVKDWYDEKWGRKLRSVRTNFKGSLTDGRGAGESAGRRADLSTGSDRVSGSSAPALGAAS